MISVPKEAILAGPHIQWVHIDGPLMTWAGHMHWLTWRERMSLVMRSRSAQDIASELWPHLDRAAKALEISK